MVALSRNKLNGAASDECGAPNANGNGRLSDGAAGRGLNGHTKSPLRIWGLPVVQLHDAYWLSRGVQCIRHGRPVRIDRAADLMLLLQPDQLVLFDLECLIRRIVWHGASLTRVQIVSKSEPAYREAMVLDDAGFVRRIERQYQPGQHAWHRVYLTDRARIAERWMNASCVQEGRSEIRRLTPRPHVDRALSHGHCFHRGNAVEEAEFLTELIDRWHDPDCMIDGIHPIADGVWKHERDPALDATLVGPVWLGLRNGVQPRVDCLVGPAWLADPPLHHAPLLPSVRVRDARPAAPAFVQASNEQAQQRRVYHRLKRIFDVGVSVSVLAVCWPVMLLIALAILIDDGRPLMFRHRRQTLGGREFNCLKFRTMRRNAEAMVAELRKRNLCDGPQVHIEDDPRVTRVGRFLRKMHLDELPQVWNVLVGDMSLVGPRPSPDNENRICPAWRELRLSVRPGITGLWQLKRTRRPGEDFQEWIRYDIEYVRRAGFWLDLNICLRTARLMLLGRRQ